MRDVWKEQMQEEQPVPVGGSSATGVPAFKAGPTTATEQQCCTAECSTLALVEVGCPSSTFVKEQQDSSADKLPSSLPNEVQEHNATRTLG